MTSQVSDLVFVETLAVLPASDFSTKFLQSSDSILNHLTGSRELHQPVINACERFFEYISEDNGIQWYRILQSIVNSLVTCFGENLLEIKRSLENTLCTSRKILEENINILCCLDVLTLSLNSIQGISIENVTTVPRDLISVILSAFEYCESYQENMNEQITKFFKKSYDLLCHYFVFLNKLKINPQYIDEFNLLIDILEKMYQVGVTVISLDLKTMAELWKGYTNILKMYSASLKSEFNVSKIIKFLVTQIMEQITRLKSNGEEKFVKLTCKISFFLLQIVLKLCEYFRDYYGDSIPTLFEFILFLYKCSSCVSKFSELSNHIMEQIDRQLLPGVDPLIEGLINDREFIKYFLQFDYKKTSDKSERIAFLLVLTLVLRKLLSCSRDTVNLWIDDHKCILDLVFKIINEHSKELCYDIKIISSCLNVNSQEISLYDALLINFSSLIINEVSYDKFATVEQLMISNLQSKTIVILFVSDLWCILARYGNSELCLQHTKYLISILNQSKQKIFLKSLIKRLFLFLSASHQLQLVPSLVEHIEIISKSRLEIRTRIISEYTNKYKYLVKSESENYPQIIRLIYVLASFESYDASMMDFVTQTWRRINSKVLLSINERDFYLFINTLTYLSKVTCLLISHLEVLDILKNLTDFLCCESTFIKLCCLDVLKSLGNYEIKSNYNEIASLIAALFNRFLKDKDFVVREYALEVFTYFSHVTKYENIISMSVAKDREIVDLVAFYVRKELPSSGNWEQFLDTLELYTENHWEPNEGCEDRVIKKIRLDYDDDDDDGICSRVSVIETNVKYIMNFIKNRNKILNVKQKDSIDKMFTVIDELKNYI